MSPVPRGPLQSAGFWLHHAALSWRQQFAAALRPLELTPTQFMLLAAAGWLTRNGDTATQQEVADFAGADRTMASKVLQGLEQRALLTRTGHPDSGRSLSISVTPAGRALTSNAVKIAVTVDDDVFGPLEHTQTMREELRRVAAQHPHSSPAATPAPDR